MVFSGNVPILHTISSLPIRSMVARQIFIPFPLSAVAMTAALLPEIPRFFPLSGKVDEPRLRPGRSKCLLSFSDPSKMFHRFAIE